jgi:hypothetical protein
MTEPTTYVEIVPTDRNAGAKRSVPRSDLSRWERRGYELSPRQKARDAGKPWKARERRAEAEEAPVERDAHDTDDGRSGAP